VEAVGEIKDQGYNDDRGDDEQLCHISPDSMICMLVSVLRGSRLCSLCRLTLGEVPRHHLPAEFT
jgi:hypothetical protein